MKFDTDIFSVYIPDGYIHDVKSLQTEFLSWVEEQHQCVGCCDKKAVLNYNVHAFLEYLNTVVLSNSRERAYLVPYNKKINAPTIVF